MVQELTDRRAYTPRSYTLENVSEAIAIFMAEGGSIQATQKELKQRWGFTPSEPTLRKWIASNDDAMLVMDSRTAANLQNNVAHVIELVYEQLVQALEAGEFPASKLGVLWGIGIDKFLKLAVVRSEMAKQNHSKDIIGDELYSDKPDLLKALLEDGKIPD